ncbi:MAG: DUF2480 family protein [Cyclobacteriaceae bacterium]
MSNEEIIPIDTVTPLPRRGDGALNRVTNSQLITLDLEEFYSPGQRTLFDIKHWLFQEQILKEKDFRESVKTHDWLQYKNKFVAITCTADATIPTWAYMLLSISLQPHANFIFFGTLPELELQLFLNTLNKIDWQKFKDAKVVIKGCSKVEVPVAVYVEATNRLRPLATSIMYGEPCSTVPLFKRKLV